MSVITVQAGVARYLLPDREAETGRVLETIESTGRQALLDMRQLLGVLRRADEGTPHSPAPGLADLSDLTASTDAAGTRVELSAGGRVRPLPEGIELSAYRIIQVPRAPRRLWPTAIRSRTRSSMKVPCSLPPSASPRNTSGFVSHGTEKASLC
jgi:Histidine kinase